MARGWESKSVEEQQSEAAAPASAGPRQTPQQSAARSKREGLELSRQRVLRQLDAAQNPLHRKMLEQALADLDAEIKSLG